MSAVTMCRDVIIILLAKVLIINCCSSNNLRKPRAKPRANLRTSSPPFGPGPESPRWWSGLGWGRPQGADKSWGKEGKIMPYYYDPPKDQPELQDPFLPDKWKGDMGPLLEDAAPPDWAYLPKNIGRPSLCFEPPKRGWCAPVKPMVTRYAFNPYEDKCQPFEYSGCRRNENNFKSEKRCNEICQKLPQPDCDPNGDPVEWTDFKEAMDG